MLNIYSQEFTHEKIHIHTDRDFYASGETIYYKAYILTEYNSLSKSKNLYADWYDENGTLISQVSAPILLSGAQGSFKIPEDFKGRALHLKAYTKWMLNFDTAFIYDKYINIYQPATAAQSNSIVEKTPGLLLTVYPEGGFSIDGLKNHFAFSVTDNKRMPVNARGVIKTNKGIIIDSVKTVHDGMGSFDLLLNKSEVYTFDCYDVSNNKVSTNITAQKEEGILLNIKQAAKKTYFSIERTKQAADNFKKLYLLVHKDQSLYYKLDIDMTVKTKINADILLTDIPAGVVQFTLFNNEWLPVAERIVFVNNHAHEFLPQVNIDKENIDSAGKNKLQVFVSDTSITNMSLAVIDAGFHNANDAILPELLLKNDIRGTIYNAAYYFPEKQGDQNDSVLLDHLDLLMLTKGHRRYDWEKIAKGDKPVIHYPQDTDYIQVKGLITSKKFKKTKDLPLLKILLQAKDSSKSVILLPVQADGSFTQKNFFYYDSIRLFYSLSNKSISQQQVTANFENRLLSNNERKEYFIKNKSGTIPGLADFGNNKYKDPPPYFVMQKKLQQLKSSATLKEVIIKSKVKTPLQVLDEYYAKGMYSGDVNNYALDIEGDKHATGYQNIMLYLESKVPGFRVSHNGIPLWYPDVNGIPFTPAFLIDEVPVSWETVYSLAVSGIAYVKAFRPPFLGSSLNGFSGVIVIYSKRGYSPLYGNDNTSSMPSAVLQGYTKFKEFLPGTNDVNADQNNINSPTVFWNPFVVTDKNNQHLSFQFDAVTTKRKLVIVLEGINADGKIIYVTKSVE